MTARDCHFDHDAVAVRDQAINRGAVRHGDNAIAIVLGDYNHPVFLTFRLLSQQPRLNMLSMDWGFRENEDITPATSRQPVAAAPTRPWEQT